MCVLCVCLQKEETTERERERKLSNTELCVCARATVLIRVKSWENKAYLWVVTNLPPVSSFPMNQHVLQCQAAVHKNVSFKLHAALKSIKLLIINNKNWNSCLLKRQNYVIRWYSMRVVSWGKTDIVHLYQNFPMYSFENLFWTETCFHVACISNRILESF